MGMVGSDNTAEQQKRGDGTAGIGGGLSRSADANDAALKRGFAAHKDTRDTKEASYAAELGAALALHAKEL